MHKHFDGTEFLASINLTVIEYEGKKALLTSWKDITQIRESEVLIRKLSRAVEFSPMSILISNLAGDMEYANPKACEVTGYSLKELVGKNPRLLQSGHTSKSEYKELWKTISAGTTWHGTFHNKKKNGELFWEAATIAPVLNENGKITHYVALKEDISIRKKMEEDLKLSEHTLNYAQEIANMGSWELDFATGKTKWSKNLYKLYEYNFPDKEIPPKYFDSLVHPDDLKILKEKSREINETRKSASIDLRLKLPSGKIIWIQNNVVPVYEGEKLTGLKGVNIDITEKKLTEEQLRSQNEKLNALMQAMPDLIFLLDKNGNFLEYYSNESERTLMPTEGIIGTNLNVLFPKETANLHLKMIRKCLTNKKLVTYEYQVPSGDSIIYYEARMTAMGNKSVLTFVRDITEKKQSETEIIKLSLAVMQSPVSVVITNLKGDIEYVNPAFEATTGYSTDEVIGKNTRMLKSGKNDDKLYKDLWQTITAGGTWKNEWINRKKNGVYYWENISITPIHDEAGKLQHFLAIKQDISQQKKDEQEIRDLNANLELKILERTSELAATNDNLIKEIEDKNKAELALKEKTVELENFFNVALDLLCIADTEGHFLKVNKTW
jgi:PAS domain S-box-containing protein